MTKNEKEEGEEEHSKMPITGEQKITKSTTRELKVTKPELGHP